VCDGAKTTSATILSLCPALAKQLCGRHGRVGRVNFCVLFLIHPKRGVMEGVLASSSMTATCGYTDD